MAGERKIKCVLHRGKQFVWQGTFVAADEGDAMRQLLRSRKFSGRGWVAQAGSTCASFDEEDVELMAGHVGKDHVVEDSVGIKTLVASDQLAKDLAEKAREEIKNKQYEKALADAFAQAVAERDKIAARELARKISNQASRGAKVGVAGPPWPDSDRWRAGQLRCGKCRGIGCPKCYGSGWFPCDVCQGSGVRHGHSCPSCVPSSVPEPKRNSKHMTIGNSAPCTTCGGAGSYTISGGIGILGPQAVACKACNGTGRAAAVNVFGSRVSQANPWDGRSSSSALAHMLRQRAPHILEAALSNLKCEERDIVEVSVQYVASIDSDIYTVTAQTSLHERRSCRVRISSQERILLGLPKP